MALRLTAPLRAWSSRRELAHARKSADEQLLASRLPSPRLAWRIAELSSADHRISLGRSLSEVVRTADERLLPGARPVDRSAVRESRAQLLELASHLFDLDRSVRPRGLILVEHLLQDSAGPLYGHADPRVLRRELAAISGALDGAET